MEVPGVKPHQSTQWSHRMEYTNGGQRVLQKPVEFPTNTTRYSCKGGVLLEVNILQQCTPNLCWQQQRHSRLERKIRGEGQERDDHIGSGVGCTHKEEVIGEEKEAVAERTSKKRRPGKDNETWKS